jgi:hypothetical protein
LQVGVQQNKGGDSSPEPGIGGAKDRRRTVANRQKMCESAGCDYKPTNWLGSAQNHTSQEIQQAIRSVDRQSWSTCQTNGACFKLPLISRMSLLQVDIKLHSTAELKASTNQGIFCKHLNARKHPKGIKTQEKVWVKMSNVNLNVDENGIKIG